MKMDEDEFSGDGIDRLQVELLMDGWMIGNKKKRSKRMWGAQYLSRRVRRERINQRCAKLNRDETPKTPQSS